MSIEDIQTGNDLFDYVMKFGNQPGGASDDYAQEVKATIQKEYFDLLQLERWWWAMARLQGTISIPAKTDANVLTVNGNQVTLSQSIATSQKYGKFAMQANSVVYVVAAHTAGSNVLTLDASYVETPTSGRAWIYQDEFLTPPDCLKPWGPFRLRSVRSASVDLLPYNEYESRYGGTLVTGLNLKHGTVVGGQQDPTTGDMSQLLRFAGFSDVPLVLQFPYTQFHSLDFSGNVATDCPRVPRPDRWVIAEKALWTLWRNKNDQLADSAELKARNKVDEMRQFHLNMATRDRIHVSPNASLRAG